MDKCISMWTAVVKLLFQDVNWRFDIGRLHFKAQLTPRHKTNFVTVKPQIYLPKIQFCRQVSPR